MQHYISTSGRSFQLLMQLTLTEQQTDSSLRAGESSPPALGAHSHLGPGKQSRRYAILSDDILIRLSFDN